MEKKIDYLGKDFETIRSELVSFVKRYYPDSINDFSGASFNSMLLSALAYLGDKTSFYLDYYGNESYLDTATNRESILKHATSFGYLPLIGNTAYGEVSLFIEVPSDSTSLGPDTDYLPVLRSGTVFSADGQSFILSEDASWSNAEVRVGEVNSDTGIPTTYILKTVSNVISGEFKEVSFTVGDYTPFLKLRINDPDVAEIISVVDSDDNEYFQVNRLSQNVIYMATDGGDDSASNLKITAVPRRYIFSRDPMGPFLVFGSGSDNVDWESYVETPQMMFDMNSKRYISNNVFDPYKLIKNDKFGIAPENTEITVYYRSSSRSDIKVGAGSLNSVVSADFWFQDEFSLSSDVVESVRNSLEVMNEGPISGYYIFESNKELKQRIIDYNSHQERIVSLSDYKSFVYNMPRKFGSIKRCNAFVVDTGSGREINIYVLGEDNDRRLVEVQSSIKNNLLNWISSNKLTSDVVKIRDGKIVNLGFNYEIIVKRGFQKQKVLQEVQESLVEKFSNTLDIGEPFSITEILKTIHLVGGVLDVTKIHVYQKNGGEYSDMEYNVDYFRSADGLQIDALKNIIFEIKFPTLDIAGTAK